MSINLNDLRYFVAAVEHGGFAAAARAQNLPRSTLSKRVSELEQDLSATLLERSSRHFRLTALGVEFYRHAAACLLEAEAAEDAITRHISEPRGTVRITATVVRAVSLAPLLPELAKTYPRIRVVLHATDSIVDIRHDGFDIAIRSHFDELPSSDLIQRRIDSQHILLVAAPDYVERMGKPQLPEHLNTHDGVVADVITPDNGWLIYSDGLTQRVFPRPRLASNETSVLLEAARAGLGITCLPHRLCRQAIDHGHLLHLLPQHHAGILTTSLLMPPRRADLPAVRKVVDFLVMHLKT